MNAWLLLILLGTGTGQPTQAFQLGPFADQSACNQASQALFAGVDRRAAWHAVCVRQNTP